MSNVVQTTLAYHIIIVDEISFADYDKVLAKMSDHLKQLTQCDEHTFGSANICFLGDFRQLEPVGKNAIPNHERGMFWEGSLTHMVELEGTHRFNECEVMKKKLIHAALNFGGPGL